MGHESRGWLMTGKCSFIPSIILNGLLVDIYRILTVYHTLCAGHNSLSMCEFMRGGGMLK